MITIPKLAALALGKFLTEETKGRFGTSHARLAEFLPYAARLTLECIGNSDALYHDLEHSLLVTLAGHDIMMGRALLCPTNPVQDYGAIYFEVGTYSGSNGLPDWVMGVARCSKPK